MNARKLTMREEVESMLLALAQSIDKAADIGDFCEMNKLIDRRDALNRILDHCTTD